jgi:[ribosomal protein S18]-alanine N-acetyltransferase
MYVASICPDEHAAAQRIAVAAGLVVDLDAELERPWVRAFVAREAPGAPVIAFAVAWLVADEIHVIHVATSPEARRRGAGRALVEELVALGLRQGARFLLLELRRSNDGALALYRSVGFRAIGVRRGYYAADGEDAIEMMLTLDSETGSARPAPDEVHVGESA